MTKVLSLAPLGLVLFCGLLLHSVEAQVNPYNYHSLTVEGRGTLDIVTDTLRVQMTISNQNEDCYNKTMDTCDASEVQAKTNQMTQKLVSTMAKKEGVISITSGQITLQPQEQWDQKEQTSVFNGFLSTIQLTAIIKGEIAGDFLDECVRMGVTSINGIDYFISDQVMRDTQKEALKLASEDAMAQAQAVLDVLDYEVKQVKSVNVPFFSNPMKDNGPAELDSAKPGQSSVSAIRTVGYAVKLRLKYN